MKKVMLVLAWGVSMGSIICAKISKPLSTPEAVVKHLKERRVRVQLPQAPRRNIGKAISEIRQTVPTDRIAKRKAALALAKTPAVKALLTREKGKAAAARV